MQSKYIPMSLPRCVVVCMFPQLYAFWAQSNALAAFFHYRSQLRLVKYAFWPQQRIGFLFVGPCRVIYATVLLTAPAALVLLAWTTVTGNVLLAFCTNTFPAFKTTKVGAVNFCACVVSRGYCRWCLCGRFAVALTLGEFLGRCPAAYLA